MRGPHVRFYERKNSGLAIPSLPTHYKIKHMDVGYGKYFDCMFSKIKDLAN